MTELVCCVQELPRDESGIETHLQIVWLWAKLLKEGTGISLIRLKKKSPEINGTEKVIGNRSENGIGCKNRTTALV